MTPSPTRTKAGLQCAGCRTLVGSVPGKLFKYRCLNTFCPFYRAEVHG